MSYDYTKPSAGDFLSALSNLGVEGELATTPNGAVEAVRILDEAIRQVKSYLLDEGAGPKAYCDAIAGPTFDPTSTTPLDELGVSAVRREEFSEKSILVADTDDTPLPLVLSDNGIVVYRSGAFEALQFANDSILAKTGTDALDAVVAPLNTILMKRGTNDLEFYEVPENTLVGRGAGNILETIAIPENGFVGRNGSGALGALSKEELVSIIRDDVVSGLYPIGAVYLTVNNQNPGSFLGGTWAQISQGTYLAGVGTNEDGAGDELDINAGQNEGDPFKNKNVLEIADLPPLDDALIVAGNFEDGIPGSVDAGTAPDGGGWAEAGNRDSLGPYTGPDIDITISPDGESRPLSNTPPAYGVYVWQKQA